MEKMRLESKDITDENIKKILELFPNVATEAKDENGELRTAIDFDKLKQELSKDVVDGEECYDFTWVGKKEAMVEANRPIRKTLRPDRESSVDWENTQNIYIEGDNLEALKLLQESYLGKVKMIYIDPPYNTGKDFVYKDNFHKNNEDNDKDINYKNDEEEINFSKSNELFLNTESNGRFHSDWCSMIYSRLKLARNLLADDGVIFISIDDNEVDNLRDICNEVFGENNIVTNIIWQKKFSPQNDATYFSQMHDFIVCCAKKKKENKSDFGWNRILLPRTKMPESYKNPDNDPRGFWSSGDFTAEGPTPNCIYEIIAPNGKKWLPPTGKRWVYCKENFDKLYQEKRFWFGIDGCSVPRIKRYWNEVQQGMVPNSIWTFDEVGHTQEGKQETNALFGSAVFDYPKPVRLLKRILLLSTQNNDIILDFFSGSATTAHACMQLNAEDGGNRKFIMVQLPEKTDEKSEAFKAGYKNICEIGEERIRRAGKKIQEENPDKKIDVGLRVFKVDDTNMKDVYYSPNETNQKQLGLYESNIKDDRTDEDLLYGCLLDWGVELSLPHRVKIIDGKRVHIVDEDALIACFEENIPESVIRKIADMKPLRVVFRDSSFNSDDNKINVEEIFKLITPDTRVKVI